MTEEETIQYLEERLKENPKSLLFARLADIYIRRGRIDEAIDLCSQGIQHHPYYLTGNYILGKAYDLKGEQDKAEAEYKKVLLHDSHYLAAHKALGDMMLAMGWEDKAALHYREIIRIDPLEEEVHELLNSLTSGSDSVESCPEKDEKGNLHFRPISTVKTASDEDKNWGEELEKVIMEDEKASVSEESFTVSEKVRDKFKVDEERSDIEQEPVLDTSVMEKSHSIGGEEDTIETSGKDDSGLKEEEESVFEISDETAKEDVIDKVSETVSETELYTLDSPEEKVGEEKIESEEIPRSDSETFDNSDIQVTAELMGEKDFEGTTTPSLEKELSTDEEPFTFNLNKKETEQELDKVQDLEPSLPSESMMTEETGSEDVEEPEKGKGVEPSSLSSEKEPAIGEEEFSFDFEEEKTEKGEDKKILPFRQAEQEKVKDARTAIDKEPSPGMVGQKRTDSLKEEKGTEDEPKSEDSREVAGDQSVDKEGTETVLKPVKKERFQGDAKVKVNGKRGKDKEQKIISPTLGEIYKAQGQYAKAIRIYETLLKKSPQEKRYQDEIDKLKQKLKD
ncbi:tetratricopeptide repeat protein [bacterium]|nr:tetratricopeptide repeat protein [bacterium]